MLRKDQMNESTKGLQKVMDRVRETQSHIGDSPELRKAKAGLNKLHKGDRIAFIEVAEMIDVRLANQERK